MATLVEWPTCKRQVSSEAAACPQCGHAFKAAGGINMSDPIHAIGVIIVVLFGIGVLVTILAMK